MPDLVGRLRWLAAQEKIEYVAAPALCTEAADEIERLRLEAADERNAKILWNQKFVRLAETMEWQPIETAPKDGTRILAHVPGFGVDIMWRHDPGGEARNPKHHYECWVFASSQGPYPAKPTGWMPLPACG